MPAEKAGSRSPAFYDKFMAPLELFWFRRWRKRILSNLSGNVLEVGSGTGVNLEYYPEAVNCLTTIDPSDANSETLMEKGKRSGWGGRDGRCIKTTIGVGENMPFRSRSFDNVVSTLILCSVDDPDKVISEGIRVLKKGGRFIFMEHQIPKWGPQAFLFNLLTPIWKAPSGCTLNRHTQQDVEKKNGLKKIYSERRGPILGLPFFIGVYEKIGSDPIIS
jgi:ubiquinone/menaquinone biosynthesis C-methylase UbiE